MSIRSDAASIGDRDTSKVNSLASASVSGTHRNARPQIESPTPGAASSSIAGPSEPQGKPSSPPKTIGESSKSNNDEGKAFVQFIDPEPPAPFDKKLIQYEREVWRNEKNLFFESSKRENGGKPGRLKHVGCQGFLHPLL